METQTLITLKMINPNHQGFCYIMRKAVIHGCEDPDLLMVAVYYRMGSRFGVIGVVALLYNGTCVRFLFRSKRRIEKLEFLLKTEEVNMSLPSSSEQALQQSERADGSQMKRKRSSTCCHQCHKNGRGEVNQCKKCNKRYCDPCIDRWYQYGTIKEVLFVEGCPFCHTCCNCGACLQSERPAKIQDWNIINEKKTNLLGYIIRVLMPSFKKYVEEAETQDNKVLQLLVQAEAIVCLYESTDGQQTFQTSCSYLTCDAGSENFFKAASREDRTDNYLYCPMAADTEKSDLQFQSHFSNGRPVIVRGVLTVAFPLSWEPTVMERGIRTSLSKVSNSMDLNVTNCANWCQEKIKIHAFFKGYSEGVLDYQGHPKVLKLEWPPSSIFQENLPRHYGELKRCLPFKQYTHPMTDSLNDVSMCVSYGPYGEANQWGSIINLQYAMSDRVSILMHAASIPNKGKYSVSSNNTLQDLEGGAEWDIFRKKDIPKLEDYLSKHAEELWRSIPLRQHQVHPNHQRKVYLTMEHKKKLKDEYGIEPWTYAQNIGDAVFLPAGCWYQMRNLKSCIHVDVDFFTPESLFESGKLFEGLRSAPSDDFQEKHKLKVKELTLDTIGQAVEYWEKIPWGLGEKTPCLGFFTLKAKMMRLHMSREGHKFSHTTRTMLENEIQNFTPGSSSGIL